MLIADNTDEYSNYKNRDHFQARHCDDGGVSSLTRFMQVSSDFFVMCTFRCINKVQDHVSKPLHDLLSYFVLMQLKSYLLFSFYLCDHEMQVGFWFGLFGIT